MSRSIRASGVRCPLSGAGFSLAEMLIAIIVGSLVLAAVMGTLVHQQRFYMVAGDIAETRRDVELIEKVLAPEFLPLNPSAGDVVYAGSDSLRLRIFRGVYVVCDKRLLTDVQLTVRRVTPDGPDIATDSALVYSRGSLVALTDDHWEPVRITTTSSASCPDGGGGWSAIVTGLNTIMSQIPVGAPVRAFNYASYWITSENGFWVVKTDAFGTPRTIGGRLKPVSESKTSALRFRYLDATGSVTTDPTQIVEIELVVGATSNISTQRDGSPYQTNSETLLRLRNAG